MQKLDNGRIHFTVTPNKKAELKQCLETLRPHFDRRGQVTDFAHPTIDKFIEASKQGRGIEFIDYIKRWQ